MADSAKYDFNKAAPGGGLLKAGLGIAAIAGGAYLADQHFNGGRITKTVTDPDGYGKAWDLTKSAGSAVWDFTKATGHVMSDLASGPFNPWMAGIAALIAGLATLSFTSDKFNNAPGGAVGRLALRLAPALLVAFAAAGIVSNLQDHNGPQHANGRAGYEQTVPRASDDSRLQQPLKKLDTLSIAPPASPGASS